MSEWTLETIHAHFSDIMAQMDLRYQQRFDAQERAVSAALSAQKELVSAALSAADRAVQKAEIASDNRFAAVNEFRSTLTDQTKEFPTKVVVDGQISALQNQVSALTSRVDRREGSNSGLHSGWGYLVGAVGAAAAIIALFIR